MTDRRRRRPSPTVRSRRSRGRVRLRPATLSDVPLLVRHRRAMWEAMGRGSPAELDAHDRAYRRWLRREWAARRFAAYIATDPAGAPLGSGAVWLVPSQPRPGAAHLPYFPYVLSMYTEPAARGRGVASRVVGALIAWSTERGYPRVTLHASVMGRGVYTRLGFQPTNELRLDLGAGRPRRRAGRRRTR